MANFLSAYAGQQIESAIKEGLAIGYGECATAAATAAKTVTLSNGHFSLAAGAKVLIKFTYANTAANPTLSINSGTAKPIFAGGAAVTSTTSWGANTIALLTYDGTNFILSNTAVNNGKLTITKNGSNTGASTFYANASSDTTVNIPIGDTTTANKLLLSTATSGQTKWSDWSTAGFVKTANNGTVSIDSNTYLSTTGGTMTGNISYKGTNSTSAMIKFKDNTSDAYGNGIAIGGGGLVVVGAGESSDLTYGSAGDENLYLAADTGIHFYSNAQDGLASAKHMTFDATGKLTVPGNIQENGTLLANKYLGINSIAADSNKLGGQAPSYYLNFNNLSNKPEVIDLGDIDDLNDNNCFPKYTSSRSYKYGSTTYYYYTYRNSTKPTSNDQQFQITKINDSTEPTYSEVVAYSQASLIYSCAAFDLRFITAAIKNKVVANKQCWFSFNDDLYIPYWTDGTTDNLPAYYCCHKADGAVDYFISVDWANYDTVNNCYPAVRSYPQFLATEEYVYDAVSGVSAAIGYAASAAGNSALSCANNGIQTLASKLSELHQTVYWNNNVLNRLYKPRYMKAAMSYGSCIATSSALNDNIFYFGQLWPETYDKAWMVHFYLNIETLSPTSSLHGKEMVGLYDVYLYGNGGQVKCLSFNNIKDPQYKPISQLVVKPITEAASNVGYIPGSPASHLVYYLPGGSSRWAHLVGFNLSGSYEPTNSNYSRKIEVWILDYHGCQMDFKYTYQTESNLSNLTGYNASNYSTTQFIDLFDDSTATTNISSQAVNLSTTDSKKATMQYNATEDCIDFIFA